MTLAIRWSDNYQFAMTMITKKMMITMERKRDQDLETDSKETEAIMVKGKKKNAMMMKRRWEQKKMMMKLTQVTTPAPVAQMDPSLV